jgi:hypothetical protein
MTSRATTVLVACLLLASCAGTVQYGVSNAATTDANSDKAAIQVIQRSLAYDQSHCPLTNLKRGELEQSGESGTIEQVSVDICGKAQRFEIQRSLAKDDKVVLCAKKI